MEPLQPPVNIAAYLLAGLHDECALAGALQLNDPILNRVVAHHPALTPPLRDKLLLSNEIAVLVLLARRLDLPAAEKVKLLKRKLIQKEQIALRIAVMILSLDAPPGTMSDELYEYASQQPWFTERYQHSVATALAENSPHRSAALKRKAEIKGYGAESSYRTGFVAVSTIVKGVYATIKGGYRNIDLPTGAATIELAPLAKLLAEKEISSQVLISQLGDLISNQSVEFYKIFFTLLPTWTQSLPTLATTAKSLTAL